MENYVQGQMAPNPFEEAERLNQANVMAQRVGATAFWLAETRELWNSTEVNADPHAFDKADPRLYDLASMMTRKPGDEHLFGVAVGVLAASGDPEREAQFYEAIHANRDENGVQGPALPFRMLQEAAAKRLGFENTGMMVAYAQDMHQQQEQLMHILSEDEKNKKDKKDDKKPTSLHKVVEAQKKQPKVEKPFWPLAA